MIFRLYADGDPATGTPPLGIKAVCSWLNERGCRTKRGGAFGGGPLHLILTNTAYVGRWKYNVRSAKTKEKKPESEVVEIAIPPIIDQSLFDRVQAKLAANNPKVTPPRIVKGPDPAHRSCYLRSLRRRHDAAHRPSRSGNLYSYYACASRAQKGATACKGNAIRMQLLDDNVLGALKEKLFHPERLVEMLSSLAERRAVRDTAVNNRVVALQGEVSTTEQKLKRLYDSIAKGIVELDDLLGEQIAILKADREKATAALERAQSQGAGMVTIEADKVEAFSRLILDLLSNGETPALKAWLRSILGSVVVGDKAIRITGNKKVFASAVTGRNSARANVRGLVPEWRT